MLTVVRTHEVNDIAVVPPMAAARRKISALGCPGRRTRRAGQSFAREHGTGMPLCGARLHRARDRTDPGSDCQGSPAGTTSRRRRSPLNHGGPFETINSLWLKYLLSVQLRSERWVGHVRSIIENGEFSPRLPAADVATR